MKKMLLALIITLLTLPTFCFADELQEAIEDLAFDYCTKYFPKGEVCGTAGDEDRGSWDVYFDTPMFRVEGDTLWAGFTYRGTTNKGKKYIQYGTQWKGALKDISEDYSIYRDNTIIFKAKGICGDYHRGATDEFQSGIKPEYMKEFVKKMRNIIRLVKAKK